MDSNLEFIPPMMISSKKIPNNLNLINKIIVMIAQDSPHIQP